MSTFTVAAAVEEASVAAFRALEVGCRYSKDWERIILHSWANINHLFSALQLLLANSTYVICALEISQKHPGIARVHTQLFVQQFLKVLNSLVIGRACSHSKDKFFPVVASPRGG